MDTDKKRILSLIILMVSSSFLVISTTLLILYNLHIEKTKEDLVATARSQAKLIDSIARFGKQYFTSYPGSASEATMKQITEAHSEFIGFGETGEFTLAKKDGDQIVFQFRHRHGQLEVPAPIPFDSELAEPMRRALSNEASTIIGLDYRGVTVIAAYEPVHELEMGIVAKIDLSEVRQPYIRAGLHSGVLTIFIISLSAYFFTRLSSPLILKLERHAIALEDEIDRRNLYERKLSQNEEKLRNVIQSAQDAIMIVNSEGNFIEWNVAAEGIFGYAKEEVIGKSIEIIIPEKYVNSHKMAFEKYLSTGEKNVLGSTFEIIGKTKLDTIIPIELSLSSFKTIEGEFFTGFIRDIRERKQIEIELIRSEEKFKVLFDRAPIAYQSLNVNGEIIEVNETWCEKLGYVKEEVIGKNIFSFLPDEEKLKFKSSFENLRLKGNVGSLVLKILKKDGDVLEIEYVGRISRKLNGEFSHSHCILNDITEKRKAEEALKVSEKKYRNLFEYAPVGRLRSNINGKKFLEVNREVEIITGYTKKELLTISPANIWKYPDKRDIMINSLKKLGYLKNFESEILCKNGKTKHISASLYIDDEENFIEASWQDISDKKEAEQLLIESEEKLRNIIEGSSEALVFIANGVVEIVNNKFKDIFEIEINEILDKEFLLADYVVEEQKGLIALKLKELNDSGNNQLNTEFKYKTPDNKSKSIDVLVSLISFKQGKAYLYNFRDITEKKDLEDQLRQSIKLEAIGRLAGGIAHDFNNLLTVILGQSDYALSRINDADPISKDLREIRDSAIRASDLTSQLLTFSRKHQVKPKSINLNDVLKNLKTMLVRIIGENIAFRTKIGSNLDNIFIDPSQLEQIIVNLIVNAKDAMPTGGKLTIETANEKVDDEPFVFLKVSDSGSGISENLIARIFDPFFTTKEVGKGTGLGLSMVHGIVKHNGGTIDVESEIGKGTSFILHFPSTSESASIDINKNSLDDDLKGHGKILVVEDEPSVRRYTSRILSKAGYEVTEAETGEHAFHLIVEEKISVDLILTDVIMPNISGIELIQMMENNGINHKHIFVSGYSPETISKSGILKKGENYIQKPFKYSEILTMVKMIMET